jgi:mRNA-degrading endonuclease toxin of MazEF toxin-antitoxin module
MGRLGRRQVTRPERGEIWWAPAGSKLRPVVVVSADAMNRRLTKVLVVPGTTNLRGWPDEVLLQPGTLKEVTAFCCREITPLAITDLMNRAGSVPDSWLAHLCQTLARVFDCTENTATS